MDDSVISNGTCGDNGNSKLFRDDQSITGKSCDGTIEDTKTTLVGKDSDLSKSAEDGEWQWTSYLLGAWFQYFWSYAGGS